MSSTFKKLLFIYLFCLVCLAFITYCSYVFDEKWFFIIPALISPLYLIHSFVVWPLIMVSIFQPKNRPLHGIDLSILNQTIRKWINIESFAFSFLLMIGFLSENLVGGSIAYFIFAIHSLFFLFYHLWFKLHSEAKLANTASHSLSISNLYTEVIFQFGDLGKAMPSDIQTIQENSQSIRKMWRTYSLFYFVGISLGFLALQLLILFVYKVDIQFLLLEMSLLSFVIVKNMFVFGTTYFFAYKKHGTKWLAFCLVAGIYGVIKTFIWAFTKALDWEIGLIVGDFLLYSGWYILSWNLYKVNRKIQLCKQFPEDSKSFIETLEKSSSLDELYQNFQNLMQKRPQLEPIISNIYEIKKKALSIN